jgi:hypothetical protein
MKWASLEVLFCICPSTWIRMVPERDGVKARAKPIMTPVVEVVPVESWGVESTGPRENPAFPVVWLMLRLRVCVWLTVGTCC